jgi:hypothetical protein
MYTFFVYLILSYLDPKRFQIESNLTNSKNFSVLSLKI